MPPSAGTIRNAEIDRTTTSKQFNVKPLRPLPSRRDAPAPQLLLFKHSSATPTPIVQTKKEARQKRASGQIAII
jgi:hypothetical protein